MDTKFEIYIPTNNQKLVDEYAHVITTELGGCTIRWGNAGMWVDMLDHTHIWKDDITILEVYALADSISKVKLLAQKIAKDLKQQCVSVTVTPAQMLFIYP